MGLDKNSGINIGIMNKGKRNLITDVPGITVGHTTIMSGKAKTGVTAILPHGGDLFHDKVMASSFVFNGFGKTSGLVQLEELGTIETPIIMTNTLSTGTAFNAVVKYALERNEDIGRTTGTVNPIILECNDGVINDIRGLYVQEQDVFDAIEAAAEDFEEGAVGAGTGMLCLGLKGGIGSASRTLDIDGKQYTIGALVLSNFGIPGDLILNGDPIGRRILEQEKQNGKILPEGRTVADEDKDKGSIDIVIATDIPVNERQLKRLAKRAVLSLGKMGSLAGNGSGDIVIAFSTANRVSHYSNKIILPCERIYDEFIDELFRGVVESVEEAIISSLYYAETTETYDGKTIKCLREYL